MGDNRIGHGGGRNHLFDLGPATTTTGGNKVDLFLRSESPRVQQILLHQRLREEIEKNSNGKVRYIDSELYLRNQELRSPASAGSEVQSATLNIGLPSSSTTTTTATNTTATATTTNKQSSNSRIPITSAITIRDTKLPSSRDDQHQQVPLEASAPMGFSSADMIVSDTNGTTHSHKREMNHLPRSTTGDSNCQVCRIKEVREDLMNLNKIIQERNVHFSELKAKCLRNYSK